MGEYARLGKHDVKIGTCENMYYLRFDDRHKVRHIPGNVDPARELDLRWRLPFPDEDNVLPGGYDEYDRGLRLWRNVKGANGREHSEDFSFDEDLSPGTLQMTHPCGLLVNVPCHHGAKLPDLGGAKVFWNGRGHFYELAFVKNTREGVFPIIRCRACGNMWRSEWDKVLPFVADEVMRSRLEAYAGVTA